MKKIILLLVVITLISCRAFVSNKDIMIFKGNYYEEASFSYLILKYNHNVCEIFNSSGCYGSLIFKFKAEKDTLYLTFLYEQTLNKVVYPIDSNGYYPHMLLMQKNKLTDITNYDKIHDRFLETLYNEGLIDSLTYTANLNRIIPPNQKRKPNVYRKLTKYMIYYKFGK